MEKKRFTARARTGISHAGGAELTSKWRHGPELATYDGTAAGIEDMLDPANNYHSIVSTASTSAMSASALTPESRISRRWPASTTSGLDWLLTVSAAA